MGCPEDSGRANSGRDRPGASFRPLAFGTEHRACRSCPRAVPLPDSPGYLPGRRRKSSWPTSPPDRMAGEQYEEPAGHGGQEREHDVLADTPQQVRTRARGSPPQLETGDAAVGHQQHPRLKPGKQAGNELLFVDRQGTDLRGEHRMRCAFHHRAATLTCG